MHTERVISATSSCTKQTFPPKKHGDVSPVQSGTWKSHTSGDKNQNSKRSLENKYRLKTHDNAL